MKPGFVLFKHGSSRPWRKNPPLLPPLKLYREILRAHRKLPKSQRALGDDYVKAEFRAHKDITNPLQIIGFLSSWQNYLTAVKKNTDEDWRRYQIPKHVLEHMNDDQIIQFYDLMRETKNVFGESGVNNIDSGKEDKS